MFLNESIQNLHFYVKKYLNVYFPPKACLGIFFIQEI